MSHRDFLFRLGAALLPALFACRSPRQTLAIVLGTVLLLFALPVLGKPGDRPDWQPLAARPKPSRGVATGRPGLDFLQILAAVFLAALAEETARACGLDTGGFFPLILVNAALWFRQDALRVRGKAALWFVFGVLSLSALKEPALIFASVGGFLFAAGLALEKKWAAL